MEKKVCFIPEAGNRGGTDTLVFKGWFSNNQWSRAFIGRGRGLHAETEQSALTVILKLVIGGLINFILNVLSTAHLQFQSWFVPISLRSFLGILATYVKAMAPHSSTLAWKIPWMEEPGRLWSMGSLRVGHDWAASLSLFTVTHWRRKWQPTPVFLPGGSQGEGSLVGCHLWDHTKSDTTEVT